MAVYLCDNNAKCVCLVITDVFICIVCLCLKSSN